MTCMCPDDCNCHYPWRNNYCGCKQHAAQDDEHTGITPKGTALGHRYVMGTVNAYCPQCSKEHSAETGRSICVLDCDYDLDK